jgi:transcriptional antiterminator RfaH
MAELRSATISTPDFASDFSPELQLSSCGNDGQHWFAVSTMPRHEKTVVRHLDQRGVQNYLPLYQTTRKWQDRKVCLDLPLFSCYVFVRIVPAERGKVARVPGVVRLVSFNGILQPVTDEEMHRLRQVLQSCRAEPHSYMTKGKLVRIVEGPLAGLEGTVLHCRGKTRIVISIKSIMRSFITELSVNQVRLERISDNDVIGSNQPACELVG